MIVATIAALLATIALGGAVGVLYLQRVRRARLVTLHLALAIAAAILVVVSVAATPAGTGGPHGLWPVALVAGALALGYGAFRVRWGTRRGSDVALVAHVVLGIAAFFVFLAWRKTL
jgi:hypothetical protein